MAFEAVLRDNDVLWDVDFGMLQSVAALPREPAKTG